MSLRNPCAAGERFYYGYRLAAMSFFLGLVYSAIYTHSRGVFLVGQIDDFDVSRSAISLVFSVVQAVNALIAPLIGCLLDRYRARDVMTLGALWIGAGFLLMSQSAGVLQFAFLLTLFIGLGSSTIGTSANSRLLVNWFDRHRGLALSVAVMGYSTAGIVMPPVAVWLMESAGWRHAYLLFGSVVLLVLVPLLYLVVRQRPEDMGLRVDGGSLAEADTAEIPIRHAFALFARSRAFWGAALLFGAMAGVLISVNLHMFLNYTGLGLGDYRAALILSVTGGSMLVSKPLFGWLIDRLGARRSTMLALLTAAVTMTAYCFADSFLPLLLAGVLLGVSFGGIVPLQAALLSRLFDTRLFGRAYGALRLSIFPMTVTFTPLTGLTYDLTGSYAPAFAAFAALFVVVALVTPRMIRLDPGRRQ